MPETPDFDDIARPEARSWFERLVPPELLALVWFAVAGYAIYCLLT